jgi:hypothetical protein
MVDDDDDDVGGGLAWRCPRLLPSKFVRGTSIPHIMNC